MLINNVQNKIMSDNPISLHSSTSINLIKIYLKYERNFSQILFKNYSYFYRFNTIQNKIQSKSRFGNYGIKRT